MPTSALLDLAEASTGRDSPTSRSPAAASSTRPSARGREPVGAHPGAEGAYEDAARAGLARPLPRRLAAPSPAISRAASSRRRPRADRRLPAPRPAQRHGEPARRGRGDHRGGPEFDAGILYGIEPARGGRRRGEAAAGARRRADPARRSRRACSSPTGGRARRRAARAVRASRRPLLPGRREERARRRARGGARGADLIACAVYPVALAGTGSPARCWASAGRDRAGPGRRRGSNLGGGRPGRRTHRRHAGDPAPFRRSRYARPAGGCPSQSSEPSTSSCALAAPAGRLDEVSTRSSTSGVEAAGRRSPRRWGRSSRRRRSSTCSARTATARRRRAVRPREGRFGHTPGPIDPALARAVELVSEREPTKPTWISRRCARAPTGSRRATRS